MASVIKSVTIGGGGSKNDQKLHDVIYGRHFMSVYIVTFFRPWVKEQTIKCERKKLIIERRRENHLVG
jgi:hypothetical protein